MKKIHFTGNFGISFLMLFSSCKEIESHWKSDDMKKVISATSFANSNMTCRAFRVYDSYPDGEKKLDGHSLHGYEIISAAEALNSASRKELSSIIEDHDTYLRNAIPMDCLFRPGVAFRFSDQQNQVDLLICFSCNELRYYLNGRVVGQSYFKSQNLRSLVQQLFPEDEKIQKL
ncbi:hypothetical protein OAQ34_01130 [Opitutales bacterium]|nr:hypothetical protein [Opitutales bacterium]